MIYIIKQKGLYQTRSTPASFTPITVKWYISHKKSDSTRGPVTGSHHSIIMHFTFHSYRLIIGTNGYKFLEDVNQPFDPKNDCVVVLDNLSEVMIEIQHSNNLILSFYVAYFPDNLFKLIQFQVIHICSNQFLDNLLEVEPSENIQITATWDYYTLLDSTRRSEKENSRDQII